MKHYESIRERDRRKFGARGAEAPAKAIACRVRDEAGRYYDLDALLNILEINPGNPEGYLFKSRSKATSRIYWTIQRWLDEGDTWEEKRFFLENVT